MLLRSQSPQRNIGRRSRKNNFRFEKTKKKRAAPRLHELFDGSGAGNDVVSASKSKRPRRQRSKRITIVSSPQSAVARTWDAPVQRSVRRRVVTAGAIIFLFILLTIFYRVNVIAFVGHIGGAI